MVAKKYIPQEFKPGECFLCGLACEKDCVLHYECALAYDDEKKKRLKEYSMHV
jgi:hypothetical protein